MDIWSGIAGVVIGWVLGMATEAWRQWLGRKRTARALLDELSEHVDVLDQHWEAWARSLQMISSGLLDTSVPLPVAHVIFQNHYKDAAILMNKHQRRSLQLIHSYVDQINADIATHRGLLVSLVEASGNRPVVVTPQIDMTVRNNIKKMLQQLMLARFHIAYHFEHPIFPDLSSGMPGHKQLVKFLDQVRKSIDEIERQGRTVDPKRFDDFYVPEYFDKVPDQ